MEKRVYNGEVAQRLSRAAALNPYVNRIIVGLNLYYMTVEEFETFQDPIMFRSWCVSQGQRCPYKAAMAIMQQFGWVEPEGWRFHPSLPPVMRRKDYYADDEVVFLSKYFIEDVTPGQMLKYERADKKNPAHIVIEYATVRHNGKLSAHGFDDDEVSPTKWARLCQVIPGNLPASPQFFWRYVKVVS